MSFTITIMKDTVIHNYEWYIVNDTDNISNHSFAISRTSYLLN